MRNALRRGFNFLKSFIWRQTPRIVVSMQPRQNPCKIVTNQRGKSLDSKKSTQRKSLRAKPPIIKQIDSNSKTVDDLDKCSVYAVNESRSRDIYFEKSIEEKNLISSKPSIPKQEIFVKQFVLYVNPQINEKQANMQIQNQNNIKLEANNYKQEETLLPATNIISQRKQHQKVSVTKPNITELNAMNPNLFLSINDQQQPILNRKSNIQSQNIYMSTFSFQKHKQPEIKKIFDQIALININKKKQIGKRLLKSKRVDGFSNHQNFIKSIRLQKNKLTKKIPSQCGICRKQIITAQYERLACTHKIHKNCKTQYMQYQSKYRCKICQIKPRNKI